MVKHMAMNKTTVYLPDELKARLQRAAVESHRSEAEIIREGVRLAIEQHEPPRPQSGVFSSGIPHFSERVDELLEGFGAG
jgi:metal-responsive CopG/Arc/MetJ family transcriptional regulator